MHTNHPPHPSEVAVPVHQQRRRPSSVIAVLGTMPTTFAAAAVCGLVVAATINATPNRARADDGYVEYANVQRYYERLSASATIATTNALPPRQNRGGMATATAIAATTTSRRHAAHAASNRPPPLRLLGYVGAPSSGRQRPEGAQAPARMQVLAPRPPASATGEGEGHFLTFPNAEATGAAAGQTVNRAINDLD